MTNEVWRQVGFNKLITLYPAFRKLIDKGTGFMKSLQRHQLVSSVVRHVKESERSLRQWINCYVSNAGTDCDFPDATVLRDRLADSQCHTRGSEFVVVGGVTTTQGDGNPVHRAKELRFDHVSST